MSLKCRAVSCTTRLGNRVLREQHEQMFHKDFLEDAAGEMIERIIKNAQPVDLQKKVVYDDNGYFSYEEVSQMDKTSEQYVSIRKMYATFIENWLVQNPTSTVEDFFRVTVFKIR